MTTIAHISDLHFGRIDLAVAEALVGDVHEKKPDLVVISGDLTQRARPEQYQAARRFIDRLPIPQIIVPGNHDVPLYDFLRRLRDPFGRFRQFITVDEYPEFENDDVQVIGINTACRIAPRIQGFWKDGKIRTSHLDALDRILLPHGVDTGSSQRVRILIAHHPFIEPAGGHRHGAIHGGARAVPVLERLGFDLILGGHIHLSYLGDLRTRYPQLARPMFNVLAGSATSTRRREPHNAYNVLQVSRDSAVQLQRRAFVDGRWCDAGEPTAILLHPKSERGGHC